MNVVPSREAYDACVVGAGPAGGLAARELARSGHSVLLVEKSRFPRDKVCGGCLGAIGLAALADADLSLAELGVPSAPLERLDVRCGENHASLSLRNRVAIARSDLDAALTNAAEDAGAEVVFDSIARLGEAEPSGRSVHLSGRNTSSTIQAKLVVLAAGLGGGSLASVAPRDRPGQRIGVGAVAPASTELPDGRVLMTCSARGAGYVGAVRLPDGRIDLAAALDPAEIRSAGGSIGPAIARLYAESDSPPPTEVIEAPWRAVPRLTQQPRRMGADRVLLVGDAAGYVEPFTGEGMGWAMRSALAAAPIAGEAIRRWRPELISAWSRAHRRAVGGQQRRCRAVCSAIGGTRATKTLVAVLAAAPWLARPVLGSIDGRPPRTVPACP